MTQNPSLFVLYFESFQNVLFAFQPFEFQAHFTHYDVIYKEPKHFLKPKFHLFLLSFSDFVVSDDINLCSQLG